MSLVSKKVFVCGLTALFMVLLVGGAALAADVIGVIDSQQIVTQHPNFERTMTELQNIMRRKENEARAAVEAETDPARRAQIMQDRRMEMLREEHRLMEPIYNDCQEAVRAVARARNITVVLERSSVHFGGQDITQFVIQQLRR